MHKPLKFLLCLLFCAFWSFSNAQQVKPGHITELLLQPFPLALGAGGGCNHTDSTFYDRATGAEIIAEGNGGWAFGTNLFLDEFGQQFDLYTQGPTSLVEVFFWCGRKSQIQAADTVELRLYEVDTNTDSLPTGPPKAWGTVTVDNIALGAVSPAWTYVPINQGNPQITSDYLISFSVAGMNDTIGIACTSNTNGDGQGEKRIKVKLKPGQGDIWLSAADWAGFDSDLFLLPILDTCFVVGQDPLEEVFWQSGPMKLFPASPNPATDQVKIRYELLQSGLTRVVLFDIQGRLIFDSGERRQVAGFHQEVINLETLSSGKYFYTLFAGKQKLSGKIIKE